MSPRAPARFRAALAVGGALALLPLPVRAGDTPSPVIEEALAAARKHLAAAPPEHRVGILSVEWQRDGESGPRWRVDLFPRPDRHDSPSLPNVLWIGRDGTVTPARVARTLDP